MQDAHHNGNGWSLPPHIAAKIVSRETLLARVALARARGAKLVQCHGCFDIVHPGHIRHLRQAKALGTMLLVSITGDSLIAKGTGRPLIPEELRAENLASLDFVDFVHIDESKTAVELLDSVRPDVYVKGKEYEHNRDPRFEAERCTVEKHGGRVVFSSGDVVFSSTALIAAMESSVDPYHQRLMQLSRTEDLNTSRIQSVLTKFRDKCAVVIGESIIDTYVMCDRPDIAGESPVIALRPIESRQYDGGAAVVARHLAALGVRPILITALPDNASGEAMKSRLALEGVEVRAVNYGTRVPEKQRFLSGAQKLMKLDLFDPFLPDAALQREFIGLAREACEGQSTDAAIITDFGLGLFSSRMISCLCDELRPATGVLAGDVSGRKSNLRSMHGMDLLTPSESEIRDAVGLQSEGLPAVTWRMLEDTGSKAAIVTLAAEGLIAFDRLPSSGHESEEWRSRLSGEHIPAFCPIALDPLGCGDSLLACAAMGLACGGTLLQSAFIGAAAASVQASRLGNGAVGLSDIRREIARVHNAHLTYDGSLEARRVPHEAAHSSFL